MTVEELYANLIDAWNRRDAAAFEALFILDGDLVGFDGSQAHGQGAIGEHLREIFGEHPTSTYVYSDRDAACRADRQRPGSLIVG